MSVIQLSERLASLGNQDAAAWAPMTLLKRQLPKKFSIWLDNLPTDNLPDGRFLAHVRHIRAGARELFARCDVPLVEPAEWWIEDVAVLAERFVEISGQYLVDVRLERTSDNACSKFHRDNVPVRLITTYRGPGTELVPTESARRSLALQQEYRGPLQCLEAGEVAIFRGGYTGIVHRSPQIAGTGIHRSVLCLNIPSPVSPELWTPESDV